MKKKWHYIIFLLIFILMMDYGVGNLYDKLYFSKKSITNDRLIQSVICTNEDILIFGSSRALHHYNPEIITDSLHMSCFNVGSGGQNIYYHLALLESALERYKPKVAIMDLMYIDFATTSKQWETEKLSVLLPFVHKSDAVKKAVLRRGQIEKIKMLSSVYPFNSQLYYILKNNLFNIAEGIAGFLPINRTWTGEIAVHDNKQIDFDPAKIEALYNFIDICCENEIELFIFVSPHYAEQTQTSMYEGISDKIRLNYNLPVHSYESDSFFCNHPEYFADPFHLNKDGANIYSALVAHKIKCKLKNASN